MADEKLGWWDSMRMCRHVLKNGNRCRRDKMNVYVRENPQAGQDEYVYPKYCSLHIGLHKGEENF